MQTISSQLTENKQSVKKNCGDGAASVSEIDLQLHANEDFTCKLLIASILHENSRYLYELTDLVQKKILLRASCRK